jgi:hypothetical protein
MRCLSLLIALGACGGKAAPAAISGSASKPDGTYERANRALHDDAPLDYSRPLDGKRWDRKAITEQFHNSCARGDKRSCIIEAQLTLNSDVHEKYRTVAENCRAGDLMSCRALPGDLNEQRFPKLPGEMSRRDECSETELSAPCDAAALRNECTDGFPAACAALASQEPPLPDADVLATRADELAQQGCDVGIGDECLHLFFSDDHATALRAAQRHCDLDRENCIEVAVVYAKAKDKLRERDAKEQQCQYSRSYYPCIQLAIEYLDGKLDEPVPGRGQALLEYGCRKDLEENKGKLPVTDVSLCGRAKITAN